MNDDEGTLSDLWREEREACMLKGRGEGGLLGNGVIREFVSLYRGEGGDKKAVHRKHTDQPTGG